MMISTVLVEKAKMEDCFCEWMLLWCWSFSLLGLEILPLLLLLALPLTFLLHFTPSHFLSPTPFESELNTYIYFSAFPLFRWTFD